MGHYYCSKCHQHYDWCECGKVVGKSKVPVTNKLPDFHGIALQLAWQHKDSHDYIPKTFSGMVGWKAHSWVLEAMEVSYKQGLKDAESN